MDASDTCVFNLLSHILRDWEKARAIALLFFNLAFFTLQINIYEAGRKGSIFGGGVSRFGPFLGGERWVDLEHNQGGEELVDGEKGCGKRVEV